MPSTNIGGTSRCPVNVNLIRSYIMSFAKLTELPWTPYYRQEGSSDEESSLIYTWALAATILFTIAVYSFERYLNDRQRDSYKITKFPSHLEETVGKIDAEQKEADTSSTDAAAAEEKTKDDDATNSNKDKVDRHKPLLPQLQSKFEKSQSYGSDKINFSMVSAAYETFESVAYMLLGFLPFLWDEACSIGSTHFGYDETNDEIKVTLIFLLLVTLVGTVTALPFELYSTFKIEKKHGFNKMTIGLFISDKIKSLLLTFIIGGPFVALLLKIIKMGGDKFYLYVWAFMSVFSLFMMTIVPVFIMPLFNKYEPLKDGPLKDSIYALAGKLKYPLTKLFVMDGSKRSSHSNAFMFGFGSNKRIVLFDTLLTQVHDEEILAILGHELGHWKLGHTLANLFITQFYSGITFYTFSLCYSSHDLYRAFGFEGGSRPIPTMIALLLFFQTVWAPIDKIISFMMTIFSRVNEFAADKFSVDLGMSRDLQTGLCKIHLENLGAMCPDRLYSIYHYSHPPLVERLRAMMELDKKSK
uniref:Ste24 endopeptidase n=1 Tax=Ditylum brightwellii TaxID=49249 RepID=A0A7S4USK2_9STRA